MNKKDKVAKMLMENRTNFEIQILSFNLVPDPSNYDNVGMKLKTAPCLDKDPIFVSKMNELAAFAAQLYIDNLSKAS